jgi:formate hydrogenlyase subunit 3/multisubunit Na+/H+ antiporter MnhD subunit
MNVSPLVPLGLLLLGAGALLLAVMPRFRYPGLIAVSATVLALVAVLAMGAHLPAEATLSSWQPISLLPHGLLLEVDGLAWMYAIGVLVVTLATLLTGFARPGGLRITVRGAILVLAFAGLAAISTHNLVTRIVAWAGLDLVYFLALVLLARGEGLEPQAVLNLALNSTGTLLAVGAAMLISRTSLTLSLRDAAVTAESTVLISLAAVFRLGLFPLHLGLPAEANVRQGLGVMLRMVPAAVALEVMARLAVFGFAEAVRPWLSIFGIAAALVGAVQLWSIDDPRLGVTYLVIAESGVALLAGLWGGAQAAIALTAQSLALLCGGAVLYLFNGHEAKRRWLTALPVAGALAIVGLPFTLGFTGVGALYGGLMSSPAVLLAVVLMQAVLTAGMLRAAFVSAPDDSLHHDALANLAYLSGLGLPVLALISLGWLGSAQSLRSSLGALVPNMRVFTEPSGLIGLTLTALAVVAGFVAWRFEAFVRGRTDAVGAWLTPIVRLDWLYRLVWGLVRWLGIAVYNVAAVLEGEGAVLWMLVAVLVIWLLLR